MNHLKTFRNYLVGILAVLVTVTASTALQAQEVVLRLHHFLPAQQQNQQKVIEPWAQKIEQESGGRLKIEIYPSMQLGGKPPQLLDQVRDGLADIVWALPAYTPGRYPKIAAFELPFMVSTAEATSQALQDYYETHAQEEFSDFKVLWFHVHGRGLFHARESAIATAEDLQGKKVRAPNRYIGSAIEALGGSPIFMPVPALPEALSKGVVDATVIPWEIVPALKIHELAPNHTITPGERGFYTSVFVYAMNKQKYESLPDDLKKVLDDNSGMEMSKFSGQQWDIAEIDGRKPADERGNTIVEMAPAEIDKLREGTKGITEQWISDMGDEGQDLYDAANQLIDQYSQQ